MNLLMDDEDPFGGDDPLKDIQPAPTPPRKIKSPKKYIKDTHDDLGAAR